MKGGRPRLSFSESTDSQTETQNSEIETLQDILILSARRTPIGSLGGALRTVTAPELGAQAIRAASSDAKVEPSDLDQAFMGCVLSAGVGQAPARQAAMAAGCGVGVGAVTLNKVCGSGMRAMMFAANDLRCGDSQVVVAGGMESMSNVPYLIPGAREGLRLGNKELVDSLVHDGLWDPYGDVHMGNCAELCAREYQFSRTEQDDFALESYRRAQTAIEDGSFEAEVVSVEVHGRRGNVVVGKDEDPFRLDVEKARSLRPVFDSEGTVTAANASSINDGAAALILATQEVANQRGLEPMARLVAQASIAQEPEWFTTAPVKAVQAVLKRAGWGVKDVDLFEINEAFAVVTLACCRDLGIDVDRVNVNGGAVALGHPIGASGARIVVTLLHALQARGLKRGCAAICIGGGEATAILVELM